jgi:hypothetical protein
MNVRRTNAVTSISVPGVYFYDWLAECCKIIDIVILLPRVFSFSWIFLHKEKKNEIPLASIIQELGEKYTLQIVLKVTEMSVNKHTQL